MKYTEEQLMDLPMKLLTHIDIESGAEEALVQKVLNKRRRSTPALVTFNIPSSITDNLTVEKEKELQAKIDAVRNREMAKRFDEDEEEEAVPTPEELDDEPLIPELDLKKFCEFCDSKGVKHKSECTRPK